MSPPPTWTVAPWPRVASALAIGASAGTKTSHGHAERGRGGRDALGVVARRGGDDAAAAALLADRGELRRRAADLEGARALEVLGLEQRRVPPARSEIVRVESTGVRRATRATSARAAAAMSASVGDRKDRVDLDLGAQRQGRDADRRAGRRLVAEVARRRPR